MKNLYAVLGLSVRATPQQIKAAHRTKAREAHPDRGGSAEHFAEVQRAYEVLSELGVSQFVEASAADYDGDEKVLEGFFGYK